MKHNLALALTVDSLHVENVFHLPTVCKLKKTCFQIIHIFLLLSFFVRPLTPEEGEAEENSNPPPDDVETRLVSYILISVEGGGGVLALFLQF